MKIPKQSLEYYKSSYGNTLRRLRSHVRPNPPAADFANMRNVIQHWLKGER